MDPVIAQVNNRLPVIDIDAQCPLLCGECRGNVVVSDSLLIHRTLLVDGVVDTSSINNEMNSLPTRQGKFCKAGEVTKDFA